MSVVTTGPNATPDNQNNAAHAWVVVSCFQNTTLNTQQSPPGPDLYSSMVQGAAASSSNRSWRDPAEAFGGGCNQLEAPLRSVSPFNAPEVSFRTPMIIGVRLDRSKSILPSNKATPLPARAPQASSAMAACYPTTNGKDTARCKCAQDAVRRMPIIIDTCRACRPWQRPRLDPTRSAELVKRQDEQLNANVRFIRITCWCSTWLAERTSAMQPVQLRISGMRSSVRSQLWIQIRGPFGG